jgi:cobalt/nickel transport system permease protein
VVTAIAGSMLRYLGVVEGQMRRMQVARISRGHDPRWIWQAHAVASTVGALFVRTFERGERVHLAMVSRGYAGSMPAVRPLPAAGAAGWGAALLVPAVAALVAAGAAGWLP